MLSSHKNRYTVATLFFFAFFLVSILFYLLFSFSSTTLHPPLSHHPDLYLQLQLQPSPLPVHVPSPPPHQPPPPPPQHSSPTTITAIQPPPASPIPIVADHESVTVSAIPSLNKECDLYTGTWVEDENYPIYQPSSCPYVDEAYDCYFNGRNDTHYTKWRWKPHSCDLPRSISLSLDRFVCSFFDFEWIMLFSNLHVVVFVLDSV